MSCLYRLDVIFTICLAIKFHLCFYLANAKSAQKFNFVIALLPKYDHSAEHDVFLPAGTGICSA
jgi:hypothetical protein